MDDLLGAEPEERRAHQSAFRHCRKTFYTWSARFAERFLHGLEEESRAPYRRRQREYTARQYERIVALRRAHIRYGKMKLLELYRDRFPEDWQISSWKIQCIITACGLYYQPQTTKFFFQDLMDKRVLVSLYDFENREGLFPAVDSRMKFCLLTLTGSASPATRGAEFVFFAHRTGDLAERDRRITLTAEDIALLNPNTRTCPIFRSKRDAEVTKAIYRRVPVLIKEGPPEENPWGISFMTMFHMSNDSHLFHTRDQLERDGWTLEDNIFRKGTKRYLPLYEAKMIHHYDHRWATYDDLETREVTAAEKADSDFVILPRYWVPEGEVDSRLAGRWDRGWLFGWRNVTNTTNERTVIATAFPRAAVGNSLPLMMPDDSHAHAALLLLTCLSCLALDFVARLKIGGTNLNFFIYEQLPVLPPPTFAEPAPWSPDETLDHWLGPRLIELTYTARELDPLAHDFGHAGSPFPHDPERRFRLRCELDAAFFHLYGISRPDIEYILEIFPIVKRNEVELYGEYRTKQLILECYDALRVSKRAAMEDTTPRG